MSEIKVNSIKGVGASTAAITVNNTDGTCTANITNNLSNRNKIVNGGMQIFQRSTSIADIGGSNGYFAADRYRFSQSGAARFTISQSTDTPNGFGSSMKVDVTTANASPSAGQYVFFQHRIEGQNVQDFAKGSSDAKQYALSFHVKSPKTGVHCMELEDVQNTRSCSGSYTVNSANTWEKKTIIFPADTTGAITNDTANRFQLHIWLMAGTTYSSGTLATTWGSTVQANRAAGQVNLIDNTSNDFFITGIQLEVGSVATDFEHRSFGQELALCQRYYHNYRGDNGDSIGIPGTAWGTSTVTFFVQHPVTMRANPSIEGSGNARFQSSNDSASFAISGLAIVNAPTDFKTMVFNTTTSSATEHAGGSFQMQSDSAILAFNAEL